MGAEARSGAFALAKHICSYVCISTFLHFYISAFLRICEYIGRIPMCPPPYISTFLHLHLPTCPCRCISTFLHFYISALSTFLAVEGCGGMWRAVEGCRWPWGVRRLRRAGEGCGGTRRHFYISTFLHFYTSAFSTPVDSVFTFWASCKSKYYETIMIGAATCWQPHWAPLMFNSTQAL